MPNSDTSKKPGIIQKWFNRPLRIAPVWIAVFSALVIALVIYGFHLFDTFVPVEGDVRAHIFKIDFLHTYLSHASWPQWNQYWYGGIPSDPFYPPGFYVLGAALTFIFHNAVIVYKLLLVMALASNGLAAWYFARWFLKMDWRSAILCLIAYETATPLLVNYLYGEGPDLLGWSIAMLFLTVYLCRVTEGKAGNLKSAILPGLLLGIANLVHPFPVIFVSIAVVMFHLVWLLHNRVGREQAGIQLRFFAVVFGVGVILSVFYWLPVLMTFGYASPIYVFTADAWTGGMPYLVLMSVLPLVTAMIIRNKISNRIAFDFLIVCLLLASSMGFGASRLLPLGLGSLVHEFRFATIMAPFFSIMLLVYLFKNVPLKTSAKNIVKSLLLSVLMLFLVLILFRGENNRMDELAVFCAIAIVPTFILILLAFNLRNDGGEMVDKAKITSRFLAGICLISLSGIVPLSSTWTQANLARLFSYVDNYRTNEYSEILEKVTEGRLIVPIARGDLSEGDSPVTFGWQRGVETLNGPYNQGDPKFFKYTVHLEWEERWLDYTQTRLNLMQEGDAGYIFIRDAKPSLINAGDLSLIESNGYGSLLEINQEVSRADRVTPILLDVKSTRDVTEFFNILMPLGYKMVFVDAAGLDAGIKEKFGFVLLDDASKIPQYAGKSVFLLNDTESETGVTEAGRVISINAPVTVVTGELFYHGDEGDVKAWGIYETSVPPGVMYRGLAVASSIGQILLPFLDQLDYEPAGYQYTERTINISSFPGFTLVKDSYFPYWTSSHGTVMATTQGFMLVYSDLKDVKLEYNEPVAYATAGLVTVIGMVSTMGVLGLSSLTRK